MNINIKSTDRFIARHIGPNEAETSAMLEQIGVTSLDELIDEIIPKNIRLGAALDMDKDVSEYRFLQDLNQIAQKNKVWKSYIGLGYNDCIIPGVIQRNILENPGWYTQYTPYQAEIAQGRLEALLNFQTMVSDLTAMEVANASLLDEGTAAAEAMIMLFNTRNKREITAPKFFVSEMCYPQTLSILQTRAEPLGIEIVAGNEAAFEPGPDYFGCLLQYPDMNGAITDISGLIDRCHQATVFVVVAADLMSLTLLTPPGELGADVVVGNSQRMGVPLGYGGPHAGYFATKESFKRQIPGRIIGVSIDEQQQPAYRMALQTREQHIRREKATSNICTAQALLAIMAGMYAVYHGPKGIRAIGERIHALTRILDQELKTLGYRQLNEVYYDTLHLETDHLDKIRQLATNHQINFRYIDDRHLSLSIDESTQPEDIHALLQLFAEAAGASRESRDLQALADQLELNYPEKLARTSGYLTHPVFTRYQSETEMLRYIKSLENKDLSLTSSMIPLGSCTMKLNATAQLVPISWPEFSGLHPFVPVEQARGYGEIIEALENDLCRITGFDACSLQPNSGAQGEYAGLMVIRALHLDHGDAGRNIVLIPSSAHGTNPASAVMAGMKVVVVKCDEQGNIDIEDLREKASEHNDKLAALMVTYPSTHGVFEDQIREVCRIIHDNGGRVYMDGANMNAQVGLTNPANIGADVCHLNLHKTFSIPHGGGGPGMGPICVTAELAPYLPGHPLVATGGEKAIEAISAAPWGSASILLISYAYIKLLGGNGCTQATKIAMLNANYLKTRLEPYYPILYTADNGKVAHEFIIDFRQFKHSVGIEVEDIAKRLMDYNFHAPTVSFPVAGTLMVEPTESESKAELDRFCDALISIREEIREIEEGVADMQDNVLKHAPHTADRVTADDWEHPYSREKAAYPLPYLKQRKFWPPVSRINNSYGDRNLICTCLPLEAYAEEAV